MAVCDDVGDTLVSGIFRGSLAVLVARRGALDEARRLVQIAGVSTQGSHIFEYVKIRCKAAQVESFGDREIRPG